MTTRERVARHTRRQHGLVTSEQAFASGMSLRQIRRRARSGEWTVVRPTVYAVAGVPPTWHQSALAAVLAAEPGAWLSHRSAAALWGLGQVPAEGHDVLTALPRRLRLEGVRGHRSAALFSADLTRHRAIPATTPERTLVDVSGAVAPAELERMLDEAIRRRLARLERLRRCVARLGEAPGRRLATMHDLLAARLPGYDPGDSDLESRVLRLLAGRGMPVPVQQHRVSLNGRKCHIDLAYPAPRLAIELDGWDVHRTRRAFDDDRARGNALVLAGWRLIRFTSSSAGDDIVAAIAAALSACGRSGAA